MKIFFIFFLSIINISFLIIPLWDLEKSSINLLENGSSIDICIYNETKYGTNIVLEKNIWKQETEIKDQNYINLKNDTINKDKIIVDWEQIGTFYNIEKEGLYICPYGKNFLNKYNGENFTEIRSENIFNNEKDWDLFCYYFDDMNIILINFFGVTSTQYIFLKNKEGIIVERKISFWKVDTFYDASNLWFKDNEKKYYNMAFILADSEIIFIDFIIDMINIYNQYFPNKISFEYKSTYIKTYFDTPNNISYWMVANSTSEFRSGYLTYEINPINDTVYNISIKRNTVSPFNFLYPKNTKINNLKSIRNTTFIYYEIDYNKTNNETEKYYGIIDIKLNKIIFNTNEKLIKFKPLKPYSMLAYTKTQAYEICAIKENNKYVDSCSSGELLLDTEKGNYCSNTKNCDN